MEDYYEILARLIGINDCEAVDASDIRAEAKEVVDLATYDSNLDVVQQTVSLTARRHIIDLPPRTVIGPEASKTLAAWVAYAVAHGDPLGSYGHPLAAAHRAMLAAKGKNSDRTRIEVELQEWAADLVGEAEHLIDIPSERIALGTTMPSWPWYEARAVGIDWDALSTKDLETAQAKIATILANRK